MYSLELMIILCVLSCTQAIKDAEVYLDECRVKAESAKEKLEQVRVFHSSFVN